MAEAAGSAEQMERTANSGADTHDLEDILDGLMEAAEAAGEEEGGKLSVERVLDAFAERTFGALLSVIALIASLPIIGAIPGMSILTGTLIILIAGQVLIGRQTPWTPPALRRLSMNYETALKGIKASRPYVRKIDALIRPRLTVLTQGRIAQTAIAVASVLLAAFFYPMALVPGGVWAPALGVLALGLALVGNDGVLAIVGALFAAATVGLTIWAL